MDADDEPKGNVIIGVLGTDVHVVGYQLLAAAVERAGFAVTRLGAANEQDDFIKAAVETAAEAILVSSTAGQAALDGRGFRQRMTEAGLDCLLYIGGNLTVGSQADWAETEAYFRDLGFDQVFPATTTLEQAVAALERDMAGRSGRGTNP